MPVKICTRAKSTRDDNNYNNCVCYCCCHRRCTRYVRSPRFRGRVARLRKTRGPRKFITRREQQPVRFEKAHGRHGRAVLDSPDTAAPPVACSRRVRLGRFRVFSAFAFEFINGNRGAIEKRPFLSIVDIFLLHPPPRPHTIDLNFANRVHQYYQIRRRACEARAPRRPSV